MKTYEQVEHAFMVWNWAKSTYLKALKRRKSAKLPYAYWMAEAQRHLDYIGDGIDPDLIKSYANTIKTELWLWKMKGWVY